MSRTLFALLILCLSTVYLVHTNRAVTAREEAVTVKLPAALAARHQQFPECMPVDDPLLSRPGAVFKARLDAGAEIYGILCEAAPYNWPFAIYVVREGDFENADRILFADYDKLTGWTGADLLYNAHFDPKTGLLRGFSKARGLGDCGTLSTLKWDGHQFALLEFRYKDVCDEDTKKPFPLIYKRHITP